MVSSMYFTEFLPKRFRAKVLKFIKGMFWLFYLRIFRSKVENDEKINKRLIKKLIFAWGNEGFSAKEDYLEACLNHTLKTNSSILECGSGLTTILMGFIAKKRGIKMITLEHSDFWAKKVQHYLQKYKLDTVILFNTPLKDFGDFEWYDVNYLTYDIKELGLIICDGPPGNTKGGRYGLIPIMKKFIKKHCIILVDDMIRDKEKVMINDWKKIIDFEIEIINTEYPFAILKIK